MVKTYLKIENIRFEDNIKVTLNLSEEDYKIMVPKFSIQLLVENAIKHGYIQKELNIKIDVKNNNINVINDGLLTKDLLYGTGLSNLKTRLELLKIGKINYKIKDNKMIFSIELKD